MTVDFQRHFADIVEFCKNRKRLQILSLLLPSCTVDGLNIIRDITESLVEIPKETSDTLHLEILRFCYELDNDNQKELQIIDMLLTKNPNDWLALCRKIEITKDRDCIGAAKLVCFCNSASDNPFMAGAFCGVGEPECALNVGVSGPGVVRAAIEELGYNADMSELANTIKKIAYKITTTGELVGRKLAKKLDIPFGVIDLSLAPTPAEGDSVAGIFQAMGLEHAGAHGTTAALAMLNDAVKKGGIMASSHVGGLSGAFIPVSEDAGMIEAATLGHLTFDKLEAMTSVCSVGLDMIAIPGDTPVDTIAGMIADEMAIGMINKKTTAVRVIPVIGKGVGEKIYYGGLLGEAPVMPVNKLSSTNFVRRGGRIPAPIHSLNN